MKVSFHVARMWHTANTSPEVFEGPYETTALTYSYPSFSAPFFLPLVVVGLGVSATTSAIYGKTIINTRINLY